MNLIGLARTISSKVKSKLRQKAKDIVHRMPPARLARLEAALRRGRFNALPASKSLLIALTGQGLFEPIVYSAIVMISGEKKEDRAAGLALFSILESHGIKTLLLSQKHDWEHLSGVPFQTESFLVCGPTSSAQDTLIGKSSQRVFRIGADGKNAVIKDGLSLDLRVPPQAQSRLSALASSNSKKKSPVIRFGVLCEKPDAVERFAIVAKQAASHMKFALSGMYASAVAERYPHLSFVTLEQKGPSIFEPALFEMCDAFIDLEGRAESVLSAYAAYAGLPVVSAADLSAVSQAPTRLRPLHDEIVRGLGFLTPKTQLAAKKKKISWIVPGFMKGGGGHRNIFRAAHFLQTQGHEVSLYFIAIEKTSFELNSLVREHFYPFEGRVHRYAGTIAECDVLFTTHWSTVATALENPWSASEAMYFVQDYEPLFHPMGSDYLRAEDTYRLGFYHITSGPWCERFLREEFGAQADHFLFPVDRETYRPQARSKPNKNVIFFAKPEMPRRCFEIGIDALRIVKEANPELEIILFGSDQIWDVGFETTRLGLLPSIRHLAELYANADVGMVFSPTNPSLVPYEMLACGLPVVELELKYSAANYDNSRDIAALTQPNPRKLAEAILRLLNDPEERRMRIKNGIDFVHKLPTEKEMASRVEALILQRLETTASSPSPAWESTV